MGKAVIVNQLDVPVDGWEADRASLRIAHVSDFHFRRWDRACQDSQDLLLDLDYDLLVATGDFAHVPERWQPAGDLTRRFFEPIARRVPIFASLGNHDHPDLADASDMPMRFLNNESIILDEWDIELAGVDQTLQRGEDLAEALPNRPERRPTVLLAHYPSTAYRVPAGRVDLQLSGHTHGGQIRLPYFECVWPNDRIPRDKARGIHRIGDTNVHTSPGIGVSGPIRHRFRCPAEVTLLTLTAAPGAWRPRKPAEIAAAVVY